MSGFAGIVDIDDSDDAVGEDVTIEQESNGEIKHLTVIV